MRGVAGKIALNMDLSLTVPTATSQRAVPVKVIDENRYFINQHQTRYGQAKVSYTHLIAWAIVQALKKTPSLNDAYTVVDGVPHRIFRKQINLGIAVDVEGKDGKRSLLVPNLKNVGEMDFASYLRAFSDMVRRSRAASSPRTICEHDHLADESRYGGHDRVHSRLMIHVVRSSRRARSTIRPSGRAHRRKSFPSSA